MAFRRSAPPPAPRVDPVEAEKDDPPPPRRVQEKYAEAPPPAPRRRSDIWGWLVAALFAILFILALFWALTRPKTHDVPTVVGLPAATARAELQQKGFAVVVVQVLLMGGGTNVLRVLQNPGAKLEQGAHV